MRPSLLEDGLFGADLAQAMCYRFITQGFLAVTPLFCSYVAYQCRFYDENLDPVSGWFSAPLDIPASGTWPLESVFPELCVQVELKGTNGRIVPFRYGYIPEGFLTGGVNIEAPALALYGLIAINLAENTLHVRFKDKIAEPWIDWAVSPEVTTLNSRRGAVPFGLTGAVQP